MTIPRIQAFAPERVWVRPGSTFSVVADLAADEPVEAEVTVTLLDLDRVAATATRHVRLRQASARCEVSLEMPAAPRHGYGLRMEIDADGRRATATSAIEALEGWWASPRHAALTEFRHPAATARAVADLAAWHVTVAQHYDWMWRHYRYRPPKGADTFTDALGRSVSHEAVRTAIAAGRDVGIASLAYGAVYGAEPEYTDAHPDERVLDEAGEPLSLGGTFHINDLRPRSPWRERLLGEYEVAIRDFGFDGIHMDTYGPPHRGFGTDGEAIDFAAIYPGLIDEAAERVAAARVGARVLFDCVEGFPLGSIAAADAAALYVELWPPDRSFADVVRWIDRARALARGRQVVIAAYAATLRDTTELTERAAAVEPLLLLGSVIVAAGAYHHTLAEGDRVLVEGYYPAAAELTDGEARELRALWRFGARYVHLLSDPAIVPVEPEDLRVEDARGRPVTWSSRPSAGTLWVRVVRTEDGRSVAHLIDLRDQPDDHWDAPKRPAGSTTGLRLRWPGLDDAVAATPWREDGEAIPVERTEEALRLPPFRRWLMIVGR